MPAKAKATASAKPEPTSRPVLVTTGIHRGVFFGYATDYSGGDTITLKQCRNVIYWGKSVRGFLGLAATGPDSTCRIGPAAPDTYLIGISSVSEVSPEAVAAFEKAPWSNS